MTRFKIWCGIALLLTLLFVGGAIISNTAGATSVPPKNPSPNSNATFQMNQTYVPGNPAIPVHISGVTANSASTPAFTSDDVTAFLTKNGFYAGPVVQGAQLKVVSIQFVTAKQASNLMNGAHVGRPDDSLVCYVKVQGPFMLTNVSMPRGTKKTTAEFGEVVFDGHTGNMLVWGII